jgi:hypothetical protein
VLKKLLFIIVLIFIFTQSIAQKSNVVYSVNLHSGMIVKNWLTETFPKRYPSEILEFNFSKQTKGSAAWHYYYAYPQVGISFFTGYLGNQKQFGTPFGLVPTINFGTQKTGKWDWKLSLGMGLVYFTHPYDSITNPYNILIGSHITNLSFARLWVMRPITKKLTAQIGFATMHASNAHYQIPNVGMNIPSLSLGLIYKPDLSETEETIKPEITNRRWYFNARFGLGVHEFAETIRPVGTPKYTIYVFSPYASKRIGNMGQLDIGGSLKYYTDFYKQNQLLNLLAVDKKNAMVGSLMLGYEFMLNRFCLLTQGLLDVYNPFYKAYDDYSGRTKDYRRFLETWTSSRLGLQYYFFDNETRKGPNIFAGLFVDANFGEADFVEVSLGIKI